VQTRAAHPIRATIQHSTNEAVAPAAPAPDNAGNTSMVMGAKQMSEKVYAVPAEWASRAWVDEQKYQSMYKRSVEDPDGFWGDMGKRVDWIKPYSKVKNVSFGPGDVSIKWYEDGTLNVCANCVDRHLKTRGDQVAIIWEGDDPTVDQQITYRQLYEKVCKFANVLKANGVISRPAFPSTCCCTRWRAITTLPLLTGCSPIERAVRS
jgi:hypothetical protein